MHAVIKTGGKQYRVTEGDVLRIEKMELGVGENIEFDQVLMVSDGETVKIGAPILEGGKVTATVKSQLRGEKIKIVKFRRRKHYRKETGHRQYYTEVQITDITGG